MSRQCCFLSMDSLEGYVSDDELAIKPLNDLGWEVSTVSWRDTTVDWGSFEIVVIRTAWDYQRTPDAFLKVLEKINRYGTTVLLTTHNEEIVNRLKRRVVTIEGGRVASDRANAEYHA